MGQKRPYRVLLVDLAKSFGGAEVRVLTQARALQGRVEDCHVVTLAGSELHQRLQAEALPHYPITVGRASPRLLLTLRGLMRRGGFSVVDAHNVQSILWGHWAAWLAGVPGRVSTIHSDFGKEYTGWKGALYEGVLRLNRLVTRQYINVTEVLQAKSEVGGDGDRSTLIHNAVPVPETPPAETDRTLWPEWGFADGDFVVGIVARLKPVKGHTYLLEALARLDDLPHVKLVIVGDGPLRADLEAQAAALGITQRVHFAGFRQDIPQVMQALDVMCLASLSEALPYVVLEAASYARPLLVTSVGGLTTLLHDRETAVMVPAQDADALAAGIRWLAEHPAHAKQIGLAGYALVKRAFSVDVMIEQIIDVYDRTLKS